MMKQDDIPLLQARSIYKNFKSPAGSIEVLRGIEFELSRGELLAVMGESGSGKSTLLHVLGALELPDSGSAILDGLSLFELSAEKISTVRNSGIGFVYQAHHLIPELDACENVMLPLMVGGKSRQQALPIALSMLKRLGLEHRASHRPARLSGGEAQRVSVARAMINSPKLLLADEPTGNLDEYTAMEVFSVIKQLCHEENASVVMVTHSLALAQHCDRILQLHAGLLQEYQTKIL
ncbi:MAG: ABC transporter ATP-binding protein [Mariprofundaceae bacterium]